MSIMDTLITDRTQADADARNDKGTYNASDLNRVTEAMEYLKDLLASYGYSLPNYKRIMLPRPGHYEAQTVTKPILPDGYTQLEYIESTGTQYIDTSVICDSASYEFRIKYLKDNTQSNQTLFCAADNDTLWTGGPYYNTETTNRLALGNSFNQHIFTVSSSTVYDYSLAVNLSDHTWKITVNGSVYNGTFTGSVSQNPVYLLGSNNSGTAVQLCALKLYEFTAKKNDQFVRNLIPCKRNSDGAIGMYDLVTKAFFENAGTGVFTAGPENIEYETITEEVLVPDERDPYTWFEDDIPTSCVMAQYITNLSELRSQFAQAETTPSVPSKMDELTWKEANNIEKILEDVDTLLTNIASGWFYSGELYAGEV